MSTTQPIRNRELLKKFKDFYRITEPNPRNYTIIIIGLNTALRINDILNLSYDTVYCKGRVREHIFVREKKTGKENRILLNNEVRMALTQYHKVLKKTDMHQKGNPFIFPSPRKENQPLSRYQAYRMICAAAQALGLGEHISCHSLRKTFGYHAWKQGNDPTVIMVIFNHSSFSITKRYLCIEQDDKDAVFRNIDL
ncbi:MAG: tyrosine-type recombinase/integrase [Lachnospiraceae bacterium]|nr:tyrosine-type recombinase/integrase [Lachnospiraceae bacterium]